MWPHILLLGRQAGSERMQAQPAAVCSLCTLATNPASALPFSALQPHSRPTPGAF